LNDIFIPYLLVQEP